MKSKVLTVNTGTDIVFCTPTHPYAAAWSAKRYIEKIADSKEYEFELNLNQPEAITVINTLAPKHNIKVKFRINGKNAKYEEVEADFRRAQDFVKTVVNQTTNPNNE